MGLRVHSQKAPLFFTASPGQVECGFDATIRDWGVLGPLVWVFPPVWMLMEAVAKILHHRCAAILLVPALGQHHCPPLSNRAAGHFRSVLILGGYHSGSEWQRRDSSLPSNFWGLHIFGGARKCARDPRRSKLASIYAKGHFPNEEHHVTGESAVSSDVAYSQKRECDLRKTKLCKGLFRQKV
jgi:hypothetical protein